MNIAILSHLALVDLYSYDNKSYLDFENWSIGMFPQLLGIDAIFSFKAVGSWTKFSTCLK